MQHRHLNHQEFTAVAIDDIVARGNRADWVALRDAAIGDPGLLRKIMRVCAAHADDPYAQRHHLWRQYATRRLA